MVWNGLELVNDYSAELGDTSSAFKTKVLRWINEGIKEIATSHQWPFLRERGQVVLKANQDTHIITLEKPTAPTVTAIAGGSLTLVNQYKFLVTFYEALSGVESVAGESTAPMTFTGTDLTAQLSSIPVSSSPLVTARKVYISKAGAAFQYCGTIPNNLAATPAVDPLDPDVPVTFNVTGDSLSRLMPPDEDAVFMIDGDFYLENNRILSGTSLQDLIFGINGVNSKGTPDRWAPVNEEEIRVYPSPSSDTVATFYYFKLPARVYGLSTSVPEMPSWIQSDLRNYVMWRGYDFRDRAGKESKKLNFQDDLKLTISKKGKPAKKSGRVRCTTPDSDGSGI